MADTNEKSVPQQVQEQHHADEKLPIGDETPDQNAQDGVRIAEAMTLSWSKKSLGAVYACMWLIYFCNALRSSFAATLDPFVTSGFASHSLMPVIAILSSIISASVYMPLAKILNMWDRTIGFSIMIVIATIGMILNASCNSFGVYAAGNVFVAVGFAGVVFSVDIVTSDTSTMKSRGLAFAFTSSPFLITAFGGPKAAETIYQDNWRWGFGAWAIVLPIVAIPMIVIMQLAKRKAKENGYLAKDTAIATPKRDFMYYITELDVVGVFLLCAGFVLFLLPFTIASSSQDEWRSAHIIAMLVIGFVLLIAFAVWERFVAQVPFLPWHLLKNRNIIGACVLSSTYQIAYYCWATYFTSYLQVVYGVSMATAGYISSIFDVVNGVNLFIVGILIRKTGRFKWILIIGVPLYILGIGLMIYFRQPNFSVGYTVMCQIFIALAGGVIIIGQQVSVMSVCEHNDIAAVLAMLNLFGNIGGSIGNSISGAIWTNTLPQKLAELLPESAQGSVQDIYESLEVQLSYEMGTEERIAIIAAYASTQRYMLITGTVIMVIAIGCVAVIRDINVKKVHQTKGVIF